MVAGICNWRLGARPRGNGVAVHAMAVQAQTQKASGIVARLVFRLVLLAAFIGFTVNVGAACATTSTAAQAMNDCGEMAAMDHDKPTPDPTKQRAANCSFACVALPQIDARELPTSLQTAARVELTITTEMGSKAVRPPVPPPRIRA